MPISRVKVDNGVSAPGSGANEVELDMELILSAAPHLAQLNVYEAPNTATGSLDMWDKIINSPTPAPVISTSWGLCEQNLSTGRAQQENDLFFLASVRGQSIFASSGDDGSTGYGSTRHKQSSTLQRAIIARMRHITIRPISPS